MMQAPSAARGWREHHLFYHADRDLLLREIVAPLAASLLASGDADHVWFVRYLLGGPHVRLRIRPRRGRAKAVAARIDAAAAEFFARYPSPQPLPEEKVRRMNREALADDARLGSADDVVWPDNSLRSTPPRFEVARYGGPALFPASLDFFAVSSSWVLRTLASGELTAAARLDVGMRAMLRQAWGLADDLAGVGQLGAWATLVFRGVLDGFVTRGDEAFERSREGLCARVRGELEALAESGPVAGDGDPHAPAWLGGASRLLARELTGADPNRRWQVAWSQVHMTANRLGLRNPEEVYVGRMLQLALAALAHDDPAFWRTVAAAHRAQVSAEPGTTLRGFTRDALRSFATSTV
ncbi:MAG TPA: lantibiotic dehydratase C-terminal domain-containing protein [Longimicrobium sp.]|nr:lantibiotic dehydratase C-terminal domain-containing protein [Longimicrobium sp.]